MVRRFPGSWRSAAAAGVLLLACAALATVWFAGTGPALRWIAARAVDASAGRLVLEDVRGSIYAGIRIGRFAYEDADLYIEGRRLALEWSPRELLFTRNLLIRSIELQSLLVRTGAQTGEPPRLPQSLRLPLRVELRRAKIDTLALEMGGTRRELRALTLSLANPEAQYLAAASVDTPWGRGVTELALAEAAPFALKGTAGFAGAGDYEAYSAQARLDGTLAAIGVSATAGAHDATAELRAALTPFEQTALKQASLHLAGLDARKFDAGLPRTDIGAELTLRAQGGRSVAGELKLSNGLAGTMDASRLPLREAQAGFEGVPEDLTLKVVRLDLGDAGRLTGAGSLRLGKLALSMATPALDLRGVYATLAATRLAGTLEVDAQGATQTLRADMHAGAYRVRIDASRRDDALQVRDARVSVGDSELALSGAMSLGQQREFRAQGKLIRFDPSRLGDYPAALINGAFSATGRLSARPEAALQFSLADSYYRGHRLQGSGKATISPERIREGSIALDFGSNRLYAAGAFGAAGDSMDWRLEAPKLGEIAAEAGGRLIASGTLAGTMEEPSGTFRAEARDIRWAGKHSAAEFSVEGSMARGVDGPLQFSAALRDYRSPALRIEAATARARGRRSDHEFSIAARNAAIDLRATLAGAWHSGAGWSGRIMSFDNRGRYAAALEAPASVAVQGADFTLGAARLRFAQGTVRVDEIARRAGGYFSSGSLSGLDSAYLLGLAGQAPAVSSTLTLGGSWTLAAANTINGELELHREQGDLSLLSEPPTAAGLTRLLLAATVVDDHLAAKLDAAGTVLGAISASVETTLARRGSSVGVPGSAALSFDGELTVPSLAWTMPLMGQRALIDGRLKGKFAGRGTAAKPVLSGNIAADGLKFEYPEQGIYLRDGSVRARLQDDGMLLERIALRAGGGALEGKGSVSWESGAMDARVALTANKLEVLRQLDRHLVISGDAQAWLQGGSVHASATLKADRGEITLPGTDAPTLSPDVVVLGRDGESGKRKSRFAADLDLNLDLGEQFRLKGRGIDARLAGAVRVRAKTGEPTTASGSIRVAQGSYSAYGQLLVIDRGVLNFAGPLDNPGLDIVALRKKQAVEAGVAIRGTALAPQISLVSNPSVPDSEKLSWLVLGHGMEGASRNDLGLLQTAAGALLARGDSVTLQNRIASTTGLDEISVGSGAGANGLESAVLTLGKRLSSRAYLSVDQGIGASMRLVKISYALTPRVSVRAETGTDSAVDVFYTFSFR
ncbi:MAG: translocation/assembly module TamB domain-containing protein [Burkholderiales bacterium]|nr:translocation/assembly module TamB domain-containing protein [Burkholderiales bacterium]